MIVGYVVIGLSLLCIASVGWWRYRWWQREQPRIWYRSIGLRYMPGAEKPWENYDLAIDVLLEVLAESAFAPDFAQRVWIDVVGYEDVVTSREHPTGFVDERGYPVRAPRTVLDAERVGKVTGTCFSVQPWAVPGSPRWWVIRVLQMRLGDSPLQCTQATGRGPTRSMGYSALFHEFFEHVVPDATGQGRNTWHTRQDLAHLTATAHARYKVRASKRARIKPPSDGNAPA